MHRFTKKQLCHYKQRLEADRRAYGMVFQVCGPSYRALMSFKPSRMKTPVFDEYLKQIILSHLASLSEYDSVVDRLADLD